MAARGGAGVFPRALSPARGAALRGRERGNPRARAAAKRAVCPHGQPPLVPEPRCGCDPRALRLECAVLRQGFAAARALRHQAQWPGALDALFVALTIRVQFLPVSLPGFAFDFQLLTVNLGFRLAMFVHLHCHSHYSFLRAVPSPAEIIAAAAEHAMPAGALSDTGGLSGPGPFYLAAREAGGESILRGRLAPAK